MTIHEATEGGSVVGLPGHSRTYVMGDTAYRFKRDGGPMATGHPVCWMDGGWKDMRNNGYRSISRAWTDTITVLE